MIDFYYFIDVDGNEIDFKENMCYLSDELKVLYLLLKNAEKSKDNNAFMAHAVRIVEDLRDVVNEISYACHSNCVSCNLSGFAFISGDV